MKTDLYEEITSRIIAQLEAGIVPWKSPCLCKGGFPKNYATQKEYSGINVFLLGMLRFTSPHFMTFIQAQQLGGHVRKGEHGFLVVKYGTYSKKDDAPAEGDSEAETRRFLKGYTVFNVSQIEGIEFPPEVLPPPLTLTERTERARAIISGMPNPPAIREGEAIPCYRPASDTVTMPQSGYFSSETAYYSTLFHELGHATGHHTRLARKTLTENKGIHADGDTSRRTYAEEELVAEMSAAFLNAHAGTVEEELPNSAAYLSGWINALKSKDGKGLIIRAASQAQKAANYILNIQPEGSRHE